MRNNFLKVGFLIFLPLIILGACAGFFVFKNYQKLNLESKPDFQKLDKIEELRGKDLLKIEETEKEISTPPPLAIPRTEKAANTIGKEKIIYWTNFERKEEGILELKENETLNKAAEQKLDDMFREQYFEHTSPSGEGAGDIVEELGYKYLRVGENLALGNFKSEKELVNGWMGSKGHRENILNLNFKEIGVAARKSLFKGKETFLAVQIFASPYSGCKSPDKSLLLAINAGKEELEKNQTKAKILSSEIETLQTENEKLYQDAVNLIADGENLIEQGNQLIEKGNQESSEEEAEKYWKEGEDLQKEGQEKIDLAISLQKEIEKNNSLINARIEEYNDLVSKIDSLFGELQELISAYNSQVSKFNQCAK